jgi:hypothetical protein
MNVSKMLCTWFTARDLKNESILPPTEPAAPPPPPPPSPSAVLAAGIDPACRAMRRYPGTSAREWM